MYCVTKAPQSKLILLDDLFEARVNLFLHIYCMSDMGDIITSGQPYQNDFQDDAMFIQPE